LAIVLPLRKANNFITFAIIVIHILFLYRVLFSKTYNNFCESNKYTTLPYYKDKIYNEVMLMKKIIWHGKHYAIVNAIHLVSNDFGRNVVIALARWRHYIIVTNARQLGFPTFS